MGNEENKGLNENFETVNKEITENMQENKAGDLCASNGVCEISNHTNIEAKENMNEASSTLPDEGAPLGMLWGAEDENYSSNEMYREIEDTTPKPFKFFERVACLFASPMRLMENIKYNPKFLQPILALIVLSIITGALSTMLQPIVMREQSNAMVEMFGVSIYSDEMIAQISNMSLMIMLTGVLSMVALVIFLSFVYSVIFLIVSKITKGPARLAQYFSMFLHTNMLSYTGMVIVLLLSLALGTSLNFTSLAAILSPDGSMYSPAHAMLSSVSIFTIWAAFLYYCGVKTLNGFSSLKAGVIAVLTFIVEIIFAGVVMVVSSSFLRLSVETLQKMQ